MNKNKILTIIACIVLAIIVVAIIIVKQGKNNTKNPNIYIKTDSIAEIIELKKTKRAATMQAIIASL